MDYYGILGPLIRLIPAESAHEASLCALAKGWVPSLAPVTSHMLTSSCFGMNFPNPVGMAAGFDKNAEAIDGLFAQGFGFVEAGTVTPLPQPGNPRPRLFRLHEDRAVINRLGFNNKGMHAFAANLKKRKKIAGVIGANIGRNKDSLDATYDYNACLEAVYDYADYITVNISSPNTVGLRDLQRKEALGSLMQAISEKRATLAKGKSVKPVLYKIAPDLSLQNKEDIVEMASLHNVDGLIVTNTTITRPDMLKSRFAKETGGLSGQPLFALSTQTLRDIHTLTKGAIPLIGVGGIASAEDAYAKIRAGASLVQLYSALVYQGFGLVRRINEGLIALLERDGLKNIAEAIGAN